MLKYTLSRILEAVPLLLLLSFLVFFLFKLIPGDYLSEMEMDPAISSKSIQNLRQDYGLDQPLLKQYWFWLMQVSRGDFGYSFAQRRPASDLIAERTHGTLLLTALALLLTLLIALPGALIGSVRLGGWPDKLVLFSSLIGLSIPTILSALFLLYFAYLTGWFPIGGADNWRHALLPAMTLAIPMVGFFTRTLRLELIDVFEQPYMLAVVARGLPTHRVIWHGLRNAINPLISLTGVTLGGLLSGAVVVEKVFSWPGLGALTVDSILARDLYVALDCVLVSALVVILANLLADLLLAWNDPQIRYE
jgi:peptide/nickel transport system permease protein